MTRPINHKEVSAARSRASTKLFQATTAVIGLLALSGCSTLSHIGDQTMDTASNLFAKTNVNSQHFKSRVYTGASAGATRLSPDTSDTRFTLSGRDGAATQ